MLPKWAWSGSREQFLHCVLRKFRHSKSSVDRWYTQLNVVGLFMTHLRQWKRLCRVMVECTLSITHCLRLNLQLHTIDLVRTCPISSFCTVAWQLARFQLTRRIGDSWASCFINQYFRFTLGFRLFLSFCHLGFSKIRNFNGLSHVRDQCAPQCQISSKSVKRLRRYSDLTVFKMAAVRHLGFWKFKFFNGLGG